MDSNFDKNFASVQHPSHDTADKDMCQCKAERCPAIVCYHGMDGLVDDISRSYGIEKDGHDLAQDIKE